MEDNTMGAAGNKKPKKEKHGKHVAFYEQSGDISLTNDTFKKKK